MVSASSLRAATSNAVRASAFTSSGAVYGRISLGKIWGTATLIVMGIGPALGSFMGGYLADTSGNFTASIKFAMASFAISAVVAFLMPLSATSKAEVTQQEAAKVTA